MEFDENGGDVAVPLESEQTGGDCQFDVLLAATNLERLKLQQLQQLSPSALAYLGDAVYELYIRTYYLMPPQRLQAYHKKVVSQVRAETQAHYLQLLQPHLTQTEQDVVRRGRNAANRVPKRLAPAIYQQATSLEALLGYLYVTDPPRLAQIFTYLQAAFQQQTAEV